MTDSGKICIDQVEAAGTAQPYDNYAGYLADQMARLDLLIQREVLAHRTTREQAESWMGFLAVSDGEVDELLRQPALHQVSQTTGSDERTVDREAEILNTRIQERVNASLRAGLPLPLLSLARAFRLMPVEIDALLACIGPELDKKYERLYGYLHDDMTRRRPSLGLILDLCHGDFADRMQMRSIFSPRAPLMKYQLLKPTEEAPGSSSFISRPVRLDERILAYILGEPGTDLEIEDLLEQETDGENPASKPQSNHDAVLTRLMTAVENCFKKEQIVQKPVFYLYGKPKAGKRAIALEITRRLGITLLSVDALELEGAPSGLKKSGFHLFREGLLNQRAVHIRNIDALMEGDRGRNKLKLLLAYIQDMGGITFFSGEKPWSWPVPEGRILFLPMELPHPGFEQQISIWRSALGKGEEFSDAEVAALASKYPSTPAQVHEALRVARNCALSRTGNPGITVDDIEFGHRTRSVPDLGPLAQRIEPRHSWDDLVLPTEQTARLRDVCSHITHRVAVYGSWGFGKKISLGKGLNVLFCGPPGTGKTMAAEILAHELRLGLYKIDLSQIVSKYIGETEKNLHQIFREAQASHAILFFDEADALLGKRSDVKDSHDRYANLEIAYLLQKMEEYEGITILATNLRQNMDEAFTRRIRFIIEFPFPEEDSRLRIWKGIWPKETPLAENVALPLLAKRFKLAGGNIRNVALASAFLASSDGCTVDMKHLLKATKQEFLKMGRLVDENEFA